MYNYGRPYYYSDPYNYNQNFYINEQYPFNNNNIANTEYYYQSYPYNVQNPNYHEINYGKNSTQITNKINVKRKDDSHTQYKKQNPYVQNNQGHPNNIQPKKNTEINNDKFNQNQNIQLNFDYNSIQNNQANYNNHQNNQEINNKEYYEELYKATKNMKEKAGNIKKPMTQVAGSYNSGFSLKPEEKTPKNKTETLPQNPTNKTKNSNDNNNLNNIQNIIQSHFQLPSTYCFHYIGLYNIGSTCYMNAILQCLFHISPLVSYFINIYNDKKNSDFLKKLNESSSTKGEISDAFLGLLTLISHEGSNKNSNSNNPMRPNTVIYQNYNKLNKAVSPEIFQKTVGKYNPQFKNLEANDSKDLILYVLQAMHQELNYYTRNEAFTGYPDQYDRNNSLKAFIHSYDVINFSIISYLFYGTNETVTKCLKCNTYIYNFQKFEFLIFGVRFYDKKEFSLYNGFNDYTRIDKLTGDNQYYCNVCKKLCDAEMTTKIILPPKYLLINIDYGKNKKYMPKSINYQNELDITKYMSYNDGKPIKYKLLTICSHMGSSGSFGHYIAYCRHKENGKWYQFNDAFVSECRQEEIINGGDPYLLLYEKID